MLDIIRDNPGVAVLVAGAIVVFVTMFVSWWRVGRDPKPGLVIPRSEPPRGLSPEALGWIYGRGHSKYYFGRSFTTAVISLGARGRLLIEEVNKTIKLISRDQEIAVSDHDLPPGERALLTVFFEPYSTFYLDKYNKQQIRGATADLHNSIFARLEGRYFTTNWPSIIIGFSAAAISLLLFYFLGRPVTDVAVSVGAHLVGGLFVGFASSKVCACVRGQAPQISLNNFFGLLATAGSVIVMMTFHYIDLAVNDVGDASIQLISVLASACTGVSLGAFAVLMAKPTSEGRHILDEIEGLRFYLAARGTERLKMVGMPVITKELFESRLPYAVALGVERNWSQVFEKQMDESVTDERVNYQPSFYHGPSFRPGEISPFVVRLVKTIHAAHDKLMQDE